MKRSIYTALLLAFAFLLIPEVVQSQTRRVYRSVNNKTEQNNTTQQPTTPTRVTNTSTNSPAQRSELQVDPNTRTGRPQDSYRERSETAGKAAPEPKISGITTVRRRSADQTLETPAGPATHPAARPTVAATPAPTAQPAPTQQTAAPATPVSRPVTTAPAVRQVTSQPYQQQQQPSYGGGYQSSDWQLFRNVRVSLLSESDKAYFRKYSVVIGSFRSYNNADFVRRTFNSLGEHVIIVKGENGSYYTLLASFDNQTAAVQKLESATRQYQAGLSRSRRVSKYGISFDDLWIMVSE